MVEAEIMNSEFETHDEQDFSLDEQNFSLMGKKLQKEEEDDKTLHFVLDDKQVERLKFERAFHVEQMHRNSLRGAEEMNVFTRYTNGSVIPAGRVDPKLLKMTPLKVSSRFGESKLMQFAKRAKEASQEEKPPPDSWEDVADEDFNIPLQVVNRGRSGEDKPLVTLPMMLIDVSSCKGLEKSERELRHEIFEELLATTESLDEKVEAMFEVKACFHTTSERYIDDLNHLAQLYPERSFIWVEYPIGLYCKDIGGMEKVEEIWQQVEEKVAMYCEFESVKLLKRWVRICSRSMLWKRAILDEIQVIADQEELASLERQEIGQRMKDLGLLRQELTTLLSEADEEDHDFLQVQATCKEQLTQINEELEECEATFTKLKAQDDVQHDAENDEEMNVLDMILSMVLDRCTLEMRPDEVSNNNSDFVERIFGLHKYIRNKWIEEFGRMPKL